MRLPRSLVLPLCGSVQMSYSVAHQPRRWALILTRVTILPLTGMSPRGAIMRPLALHHRLRALRGKAAIAPASMRLMAVTATLHTSQPARIDLPFLLQVRT